MLRSIKRWSINGALALCVLSGSVVMDGNTLEVEAQDDAVEEMAADYFNASDTNKDGKVTWNEMLAREREYKAAGRKQMSEEQRKAFNARYEFVIEREMFLHADADDNLEVTLAEYTKFLMDAQKEDATEPAYTDKDARQLAVVNLDEQWDGLLSDADANNDKKLQHQEIRDHFLLDEVKRGGRINPDGTKEEWEEGVDEDISEAFAAADANKDKALDKAEYAEFMALEYKAGDERFLIYADQTPDRRDDRTTGETKVPPIKLTRGSTMFFKEMTSLHKDPRTGQWTRELQYKVVTIEKASALGFQGHSIRVDASKKRIEDGDGSYNRGWPKGFDQDKFKLETLKISGVDYVCGYNEYEVPRQQTINDEKVGGEGMKKVQVWHLRGLPGLEVKRIDDGVVTFELLELNIKK